MLVRGSVTSNQSRRKSSSERRPEVALSPQICENQAKLEILWAPSPRFKAHSNVIDWSPNWARSQINSGAWPKVPLPLYCYDITAPPVTKICYKPREHGVPTRTLGTRFTALLLQQPLVSRGDQPAKNRLPKQPNRLSCPKKRWMKFRRVKKAP